MKRPPTGVQKLALQMKEWADEDGPGIINWEHVAKMTIEQGGCNECASNRKEHRTRTKVEGSS